MNLLGKNKELIKLRIKAYELAMRIPITPEYKTLSSWLDYKSREIYHWLLTGEN